MSAKIEILPRKEFVITLEDGKEIKGQYSTWALSRFCQKMGLTLAQMGEALGGNITIQNMLEFILSAVEYTARKNKAVFGYTDIDVSDWIDQLGGLNDPNLIKLISLANDKTEDTDEKKNQEEVVN